VQLKGRMYLKVLSPAGKVLHERSAENIVLRQGAAIVARLLSGAAGAVPINAVQVGFGLEAATAEALVLTPPPPPVPPAAPIPPEALRAVVAADSFSVVTDKPDAVQLLVSSVFHPTVELLNVSEAGLLAGDQLYNQVVFEPVTLRVGQDVTLFWEIDFPFGH